MRPFYVLYLNKIETDQMGYITTPKSLSPVPINHYLLFWMTFSISHVWFELVTKSIAMLLENQDFANMDVLKRQKESTQLEYWKSTGRILEELSRDKLKVDFKGWYTV